MGPALRMGWLYPHRDGDEASSAALSDCPDNIDRSAHSWTGLWCCGVYRARSSTSTLRWCYSATWHFTQLRRNNSVSVQDDEPMDCSACSDDGDSIDVLAVL